jgi:hypothetical protein
MLYALTTDKGIFLIFGKQLSGMKVFFLALLVTLINACNPGVKNAVKPEDPRLTNPVITPVKLGPEQIPATIKFKGTLHEAWKWNDRFGEQILVASVVEPYPTKDSQTEDAQTSELYACRFIKSNTGYSPAGCLADSVVDCPFDITLEFINGAIMITDLDHDGKAETKLQYRIICRSDVSPAVMKLALQEHNDNYILRGFTWVNAGGEDSFALKESEINLEVLPTPADESQRYAQQAGRYESEKDFENAPRVFLEFARREWLKHAKESFE